MIRRFMLVIGAMFAIMVLVQVFPNFVFSRSIQGAGKFAPEMILRGVQENSERRLAVVETEMTEQERRIDELDHGQYAARITLIEAKIDTIFELGRIVLAASIVSLAGWITAAIGWVVKRSITPTPEPVSSRIRRRHDED